MSRMRQPTDGTPLVTGDIGIKGGFLVSQQPTGTYKHVGGSSQPSILSPITGRGWDVDYGPRMNHDKEPKLYESPQIVKSMTRARLFLAVIQNLGMGNLGNYGQPVPCQWE